MFGILTDFRNISGKEKEIVNTYVTFMIEKGKMEFLYQALICCRTKPCT